MKRSRPSDAVLRDLEWSNEPRTLIRPGESARSVREAQTPLGTPLPVEATQEDLLREALEEGFRKGFEQGREGGMKEGFEQGRKLGLDKGLAEGRENGTREVMRQAQAGQEAVAARIEQLDGLLAGIPGQIKEQLAARLQSAEDDMIALSFTAICRVLGDKLATREGVAQCVRQAVEHCCGAGSNHSNLVAIHVNASDLDTLKGDAGFAAWFKQHGTGTIPWVADEQVQRGGCIVRSNQGSLDARLEIILGNLQELLLRERAGGTE